MRRAAIRMRKPINMRRIAGRLRPVILVASLFAAALFAEGCVVRAASANVTKPSLSTKSDHGSWYRFERGSLIPTDTPFAGKVQFSPWTVQSRATGLLAIGGTLFVALNGWGIVALPQPSSPLYRITPHVERRLFFGRTINGVYDEGENLLLDVYRNTTFATPAPEMGPLNAVLFNTKSGRFDPLVLPSGREGWEAVDVVHIPGNRWVIAWKRSLPDRVQFKYSEYSPLTAKESPLTRRAYLEAYGYDALAAAPGGLRVVATTVAARSAENSVVDLNVRIPGVSRILRFRLGSSARLAAGDANLVSVQVIEASHGYYALAPQGDILSVPTQRAARNSGSTGKAELHPLPSLPSGYVYTDLWTDGKVVVVSWEQQRFTEVGAAGLYVAPLAPPVANARPRHSARKH